MKKRFFARHSKSSAAIISLGIHAALIVMALSFVAVSVIVKEESKFEAKPVSRPKMQLRKLQVPVNIKKQKPKPRLRKRIVVVPKMNQTMPDIKMPEITGVKGGLGNAGGSGLGEAGGIGFTMPEIELFGVKGKGAKVFIILDSTNWIMEDELGGIPAYTLIKDELVRILGGLNSTVLFNVAVYSQGSDSVSLFPQLVPANAANVAKVGGWLKPLNASMSAKGYGIQTLGPGGTKITGDFVVEPLKTVNHWSKPMLYSMQQQVDTVFLLVSKWGHLLHQTAPAKSWSESKRAKYDELNRKARAKLEEENKRRKENGMDPRVLASPIHEYYPGIEHPPQPERHWYTPKELAQAFVSMRKAHDLRTPAKSGLGSRRKNTRDKFTFNVVQFIPEKEGIEEERFKQLNRILGGEYRSIAGLKAMESYLGSSAGDSND
jgi:hypothetical protein